MSIFAFWSKDFLGRLAEIRALVPSGTPLMAYTATATRIHEEIVSTLELSEVVTVKLPNYECCVYCVILVIGLVIFVNFGFDLEHSFRNSFT